MKNICKVCKRELPSDSFGIDRSQAAGRSSICLSCMRKRRYEHLTNELERQVRILYNGRCVMCDGLEDLEVIPIMPMRKRVVRGHVLICSRCKLRGIPTTPLYVRDCGKCGHRWIARSQDTIRCAKCRSPYWHRPRVKK